MAYPLAGRFARQRRAARRPEVPTSEESRSAAELAWVFLGSDPAEQATLLADRSDDLMSDPVFERVVDFAKYHDKRRGDRAATVLLLATYDLDAAIGALKVLIDPSHRAAWLEQLAGVARQTPSLYILADTIAPEHGGW